MAQEKKISADFFERDTITVSKDLLGCLLLYKSPWGLVGGYIVETEAYLGYDDPACHSARGKTKRNQTMFMGPGFVYVYLIYGLYHCLNFTTAPIEKPEAVLIRALEPVIGIDIMKKNRQKENLKDLCSGPGKLTQALGVNLDVDGTKVGDKVILKTGFKVTKNEIKATPRIGISQAKDLPWRFIIKDNDFISK